MNTLNPFRLVSRRRVVSALSLALLGAPGVRAQGAGSKTDILIGQSWPLSGPLAQPLKVVMDGQKAAFDDANARGGIGGRRIQHVVLDDAFDPRRTLDNARELVEKQSAVALFGLIGTAQTASVLPYIAEKKVPLISCYSGSPSLRAQPNPYFFTTTASYDDELVKMVRNLVALQSTRLAIVYENNPFGKLMLPTAEKIVAQEGATIVASKSLESNGADAAAAAQAVAQARPTAVILIAAGQAVVPYIKANRTYVGAPLYAFSLSIGNAAIKALGDEARGLALARVTPYPENVIQSLQREFAVSAKRHGLAVDYDHFAGYINARLMIEVLRRAGKTITPETVVSTMEKIGHLNLGGYEVNYGPNKRHGSSFVDIVMVGPNGRFIR